ncbi:MAG: NAD(P)-dependent oxidoreductase [Geminicoccaceae bacterium]|jgi:3-hydroxyisobutyrate dehydrogenase|nr:NAD(P)-dependent oxidoreductase [Geminicoccaceae bacterium]MCB9967630.1 NAD(P)-dependent oxidoreductase [Geminicoccaceae bacterium]HRY24750.1 NAD(P)-dependent oxidoreductase [Geminicoccaceae bacterium]
MNERIGVVGLGRMGLAMAETLARTGYDVTGHDVMAPARERARAAGIAVEERLGALLKGSGLVLSSLPRDADVEAIVEGPEGLLAQAPGRLLVDTSTVAPPTTRRLAPLLADHGHGLIDAPVSGGPAGAATGALTFMVGGSAAHVARARPLLDALGKAVVHVGDSGAGNLAKLVNNLFCATHLVGVGEALRLAEALAVDPARLFEAVNAASGRSAVSEVNLPRWILSGSFDSGFTMGLMRKDVRLAAALAPAAGLSLPLARAVCELWQASAATLPDDADFNRMTQFAPANDHD